MNCNTTHYRANSSSVPGDPTVEYRPVSSRSATRLRIRVGPAGIRVVQPAGRDAAEAAEFLLAHREWVLGQIERVEAQRAARRPRTTCTASILFRGQPTEVRVPETDAGRGAARVSLVDDCITVHRSALSPVPPHVGLENCLRREARAAVFHHLAAVLPRIRRTPSRVYVMGQRTKWGNCSALGNLSFNWRLILAPDSAFRYPGTHEAVHLAVPDHSPRFWLTVQSLCPDSERCRQWLCANGDRIWVDLRLPFSPGGG